ncbi:MAG: non-canonical purine NTP pyrophosphatase [Limisphaerales bacterium]
MTPRLVIATRNAHKVGEIRALLGDRFEYRTPRDFPSSPEAAETGATFEENARLKSESLAHWLLHNVPESAAPLAPWFVLADDSGLEVDALDGAPGVQSARFASPEFALDGNAPDGANNAKLLRLLADTPEDRRTARFRCVLALTRVGAVDRAPGIPPSNPTPESASVPDVVRDTRFFSGACEGRMAFVPRGSHGFGYDPLFIPEGFTESLAQLGDDIKNRISHRSHALQALLVHLDPAAV